MSPKKAEYLDISYLQAFENFYNLGIRLAPNMHYLYDHKASGHPYLFTFAEAIATGRCGRTSIMADFGP